MFTTDTFRFLSDLGKNNERAWFNENKDRYEAHVREPALEFIEAIGYPLRERVCPHLRATRSSLFRLHRDTRFSKDKAPYKTHVGMYFPHEGTPSSTRPAEKGVREEIHRPGYYLHLEPGETFMGCGMWRPPSDAVHRIRQHIVENEEAWSSVKAAGHEMMGETLKRPPAGFPKDHRFVVDLMRKDFILRLPLTEKEICAADFPDRFVDHCRQTAPLVRFLCDALDLPWD